MTGVQTCALPICSHAAEKIDAGASLVQIYSGMIYRGPALIAEAVDEIRRQKGAA